VKLVFPAATLQPDLFALKFDSGQNVRCEAAVPRQPIHVPFQWSSASGVQTIGHAIAAQGSPTAYLPELHHSYAPLSDKEQFHVIPGLSEN
jgi:hypothetical protein